MGSWLSKYFKTVPPLPGTLAEYKVKSHRQFSCTYLTKWTNLTKSNSENQWPLWETFEIPQINFLKTKLDKNSAKTEWNAYFEWYFEASK